MASARATTNEVSGVKKIEAIVRTEKLDAVVEVLEGLGHSGMNICDVKGHGRQRGMKEIFRGREYEIRFIPKTKIEVVLRDDQVEAALEAIARVARTGQIGDGKLFVSPVEDALRVRTGERGDQAL
jgi:nitrogen regulatory protein P-II 1